MHVPHSLTPSDQKGKLVRLGDNKQAQKPSNHSSVTMNRHGSREEI